MPRRSSQSKPPSGTGRRSSTRQPFSPRDPLCWQLVLIDGRPIRDKARRAYEKARSELAKAQADLDQFHNHDRPRFECWLHTRFGRLLTELRNLRSKLAQAEMLILQTQQEVFASGCSYQTAYRRVSRGQKQGADEPKNSTHQTRENQAEEDIDEEEDFFDGFFEDLLKASAKIKPSQQPAQRVRELYRALVRLLHPDHNKNLTARHSEMWHQAQKAYQERDESQLELLLTLCELERNNHDTRYATVSLLQRIINQLRRSLREIRRQLRLYKNDPAWRFTRKSNLELLHHQTQKSLEEDLFNLRRLYEDTQELIRSWRRKTRRPEYF